MLILRAFLFLCILFPLTSKAAYQNVATRQQNYFSRYTKTSLGCCALILLRLCKKVDLLSAIKQENLRAIKLFVYMGGNVNALINNHHPLVYAVQHGHTVWDKKIEIIKYLLSQGANVQATSSDGTSALIAAARAGNYWALATLLKAGATTEHRNQLGDTALLCAVRGAYYLTTGDVQPYNHLICIELLIKHNACIKTPNNSGETPIGFAAACKIRPIIDALNSKPI